MQLFKDTDFVHWSASPEELKVAEYLSEKCKEMGAKTVIEAFKVPVGDVEEARLFADGKEIPCKGMMCCGSGEVTGEFCYLPDKDKVSLEKAKGKIVMIDAGGVGKFTYKELMDAGVQGIIFQYGNLYYPNKDIDERDLRAVVVGEERKVLCATIHVSDGVKLVKNNTKEIKIVIKQNEYEGESHNVVAELPGKKDEWIVMSAHYDTTRLSHGAYDNMSGCAGLLGVLDKLKNAKLNYGVRFVFCGSEERGLLGSKAYVEAHKDEVEKMVLNINLDMIGTIMGKFIGCATAEDKLIHWLSYLGAENGFQIKTSTGVYSSDSTSFADAGIPALTMARAAGNSYAPIHCRYDRKDVLSMTRMQEDIAFIALVTERMAKSVVCPVAREIPEKLKTELDEYLSRKKKEEN